MKKYINRNYFWASLFVEQLARFDIKHVCISPGSRNTPLSLAFANNKKFKKYVHIDERSSGFFALGISKIIREPVVLVTTSGTAVAELYPAIIEAYYQRIPLIVCTADRPAYLRNTGANQTIKQDNIYRNHIRYFKDLGLPSLGNQRLKSFAEKIGKGIIISTKLNPGPIHFNFPFKKPLEPESFTDKIDFRILDFIIKKYQIKQKIVKETKINKLVDKIRAYKKPIIFCSWDNFENKFYQELALFSQKFSIPIFADGSSELRFRKGNNKNIICNLSAFIPYYKTEIDLVLQFGNTPTSKAAINFLGETKAEKIVINQYGDIKDSSRKKAKVIIIDPNEFLKIADAKKIPNSKKSEWLLEILKVDSICEKIKIDFLNSKDINIEPTIPNALLKSIPINSNLFISNSLPIRDFDLFASKKNLNIKIFTNRGASGIDGIISTASGIASQSKKLTFLVIGDLAFYHNLTALITLAKLNIPLVIVLINNNGGGIFSMLPIANTKNHFEEYFNTPHNLDFSKIVNSFSGNYFNPHTWEEFHQNIEHAKSNKTYSVIELKTDTAKSLPLRKKYSQLIKQKLSTEL